MSSGRSRSGGSVDREHGDPVPEVLAEARPRRPSRAGRGASPRRCARRRAAALAADALEACRPAARAAGAPAPRAAARRSRRGRASRRRRARTSPCRCVGGAGEAAALVAEQLGVDQPGRDRAAVHAQERPRRAARARVDRARDHLLARAGLAEDRAPARRSGATSPTRSITGREARPRRRRSSRRGPGGRAARAARGGRPRPPRAAASSSRRRRSFSSATANGSSSALRDRRRARAPNASRALRDEHEHARSAVRRRASGPSSTSPSTPARQQPGQPLAQRARARRASSARAAPGEQIASSSSRVELDARAARRVAVRRAAASVSTQLRARSMLAHERAASSGSAAGEERRDRARRPRRSRCAGRPPARPRAGMAAGVAACPSAPSIDLDRDIAINMSTVNP